MLSLISPLREETEMSKLVDKLKKATEAAPSMGFKTSAAPRRSPLVLIGEATLAHQVKLPEQVLDALLVRVSDLSGEFDSLEQLKSTLQNIPYGVSLDSLSEQGVAQLKEAGCDFVVFGAADTSVALLSEESMGKVVVADSYWGELKLRSLAQLPFDALLAEITVGEDTLTVQSLIDLKALALSGKPILLRVPYFPGEKELSALVSIQVRGLILRVTGDKDVAELVKVRSLIEKVPRPTWKNSSPAALVPPVSSAALEAEED